MKSCLYHELRVFVVIFIYQGIPWYFFFFFKLTLPPLLSSPLLDTNMDMDFFLSQMNCLFLDISDLEDVLEDYY